jgi:thioester reductase-like protein
MKNESIAITGIGCRFPGGIDCPPSFWKFLCEGGDGITKVPPDRWDLKTFYNENRELKEKIYTKKGGFLKDIDKFDPEFFNISPREATSMDPQQRLLLEVSWEALENSGTVPNNLTGTKTGVYIGLFVHDYENIHSQESEYQQYGVHSATGVSASIAANRLSYFFDFRGPSMVIDTACSSSLVAVHLACQDLWNHKSDLALAGGVNLMIKPEMFMILSRASMLSADGYCKTFDEKADGYTRSEGIGIVVLKRLSQALADKDPIYAVIRGTATNQDGRSEGLTVPNSQSQKAVINEALGSAGVKPGEIQYVEAHGTGTAVGDPVEAASLGGVYSEDRPAKDRLFVGSVKSNFGHTESAAGVAGLIKTTLMLKHHKIPPNLHFEVPNPQIPFDDLNIKVPTKLEPWPQKRKEPRKAGVNSFGFGGTNAHVILEEYQAPIGKKTSRSKINPLLIPISASTPQALKATAESYFKFLNGGSAKKFKINLADLGYSAALHKSHHSHRMALVADSVSDLSNHLDIFLAGEKSPNTSVTKQGFGKSKRLAFVCSGMGQQWPAMGRELIKTERIVSDLIKECDTLFRQYTKDWSLLKELTAEEDTSRINKTQIAQPCIFSLQIALAALWKSRGVLPDTVVGHSVGEIAAFHIAGVLSLEDAVRVCFHRSRLQQQTAGKGKMLAVGLSQEEIEPRLEAFGDRISIGAINSSTSVTLSGDAGQLEKAASIFEKEKVFNRFLKVEVPYHSPVMDSILDELHECLKNIKPLPPSIPLISTVTGDFIEDSDIESDYWCRNVREPVRFEAAVNELVETNHSGFIEISAHPALATSIMEGLSHSRNPGHVFPSLRRQEPGNITMLNSLGQLYCAGYPVDWRSLYPGKGKFIQLPGYPWQRESYWNESEESQQHRKGRSKHPLLGRRQQSAIPTWQRDVEINNPAYLKDHVVQRNIVYPGAAYIETALAAAKEIFKEDRIVIEDLKITKPLVLQTNKPVLIQAILEKHEKFSLHSQLTSSQQSWVRHTEGTLGVQKKSILSRKISINDLKERATTEIAKSTAYQILKSRDLEYGPDFQNIEHIWRNDTELLGQIKANDNINTDLETYLAHPALLDACFQIMVLGPDIGTYVPVSIDQLQMHERLPPSCWSYVQLTEQGPNRLRGNIQILADSGEPLIEVTGLTCARLFSINETIPDSIEDHLYEYCWVSKDWLDRFPGIRNTDYMPAPTVISQALQPAIDDYVKQYDRQEFYEIVRAGFNNLCIEYIIEALHKLDWESIEAGAFTSLQLAKKLGVVSEHHRLFNRLIEILGEANILKKAGRKWRVIPQLKKSDPQKTWSELLSQHPAYQAELILLDRCGCQLKKILKGEEDPLSIIFAPGSAVLEHLYRDAPSVRIYNRMIRQALSHILQQLPEGETLRVLEIGGGTGGMTSYLLSLFPENRVEYIFTDISPVFTHQAEIKFRDSRFIETQALDIEKDPLEQGFESHSFDLILASDVLHATSDLKRTLDNIKSLLSSKGMMAVIEINKAPVWLDLVFGTLKGWWSFTDKDLRPSHPIITGEKWIELLDRTGFDDSVVLLDKGTESELCVILAQGPECLTEKQPAEATALSEITEPVQENVKGPWLLLADSIGVSDRLKAELQKLQIPVVMVDKGPQFRQIDAAHFEIQADQPAAFHLLFDALSLTAETPPTVINLWNLSHPNSDLSSSSLEKLTTGSCIELLYLVQALMGRSWEMPPRLWIATNGTQTVGGLYDLQIAQTPLWGMRRVLVNEHPNLQTGIVDLSLIPSQTEVDAFLHEFLFQNTEDEIALRGNRRYVNRFLPAKTGGDVIPDNTPYRIFHNPNRSHQNFTFRETSRKKPGAGEVEVKIQAAAINFKDVAITTGLLDTDVDENGLVANLGFECSGEIVRVGSNVRRFKVGDFVLGPGSGLFGNYAIMDSKILALKPAHLSFEAAATIPIAFLTAHYALHQLAKIKKGEKVLIHTATGGVGLAAIQLCRTAGAEVLATAGTPEKRDFLRSMGIEYVGDSRTLDFAEEIEDFTNHQGVDIVINTLPDKAIAKGIALLRPITGRFIDISNYLSDSQIDLSNLKNGVTFFVFDGDDIRQTRPKLYGSLLKKIMDKFDEKIYQPLPHRVFPLSDVGGAIRHMQKATHIGKICVSTQEAGITPVPTQTAIRLKSEGTYLITGGLGGLGLAFAKWLVSCGVRHLVLTGRSGISDKKTEQEVKNLQKSGAEVIVEAADVTDENSLKAVISTIDQNMPPLRGIIHTAMVLDISILMQMTSDQLSDVLNPKIVGAWNLHTLTQKHDLDFFVMFSSFVSLFGFSGQANYSAANCFLNSLAHHRRSNGLPALTICWGAIGEMGYVARHDEIIESFRRQGIALLSPEQVWKAAGHGLTRNLVQENIFSVNWNTFAKYMPAIEKLPRYSGLYRTNAKVEAAEGLLDDRESNVELPDSPKERKELIANLLGKEIAYILGVPKGKMDHQQSFDAFGFDSLMAVELGVVIERLFQLELPKITFLQPGLNVSELVEIVETELSRAADTGKSNPDVDSIVPILPAEIDFLKEAALGDGLFPGDLKTNYNANPGSALLTGATGFLGAFLLKDLLSQTKMHITCLVRPRNGESAFERIKKNLQHYSIWEDRFRDRISPLVGDLTQPQLGLSDQQWQKLAREIDVIYHNGAWLNFALSYSALKPANVLGTLEILKLAGEKKIKQLHYVSMMGIIAQPTVDPTQILPKVDGVDYSDIFDADYIRTKGFNLGYFQSKWVADELVSKASERGLPTCIYRPTHISGDSKTGIWNTNDYACQLIKGCIQMGLASDEDTIFDFSPVDYVSQAIVYLSRRKSSLSRGFLLLNPTPIHWREMVDWIASYGFNLSRIAPDRWMQKLKDHLKQDPGNPLYTQLPLFEIRPRDHLVLGYPSYIESPRLIEKTSTQTALKKSGISCPPVDDKLLKTYFKYFIKSGFLQDPNRK